MRGEVKGSNVAELKINQGHTILKYVIKINLLLHKSESTKVMST